MKLYRLMLFFAFLSVAAAIQAQGNDTLHYFSGKWTILVKGTPQGDVKLVLSVEKKDTALKAVILDTTGNEFAKVDKLVHKDTIMTAYFSAMGYDLYLEMTRKDDDHIIGNLVGMFEAEGERIKQITEKK